MPWSGLAWPPARTSTRWTKGALRTIDPDLVVTQDLCAVCAVDISEVDQALEHLGCRAEVLTLDPMTLDEVLSSIETVGRATGTLERAAALVLSLRQRLDHVARAVATGDRPRLAVLEWTDPPFSSGHWVPDMVKAAGAASVLGVAGERSKSIEWRDVHAAQPDVIVVAPCGYRLDGRERAGRARRRGRSAARACSRVGGRCRCGLRAARSPGGRRRRDAGRNRTPGFGERPSRHGRTGSRRLGPEPRVALAHARSSSRSGAG